MNMDVHYSSLSYEWSTPQELFDDLDKKFHFTLDPCASHSNHKCDKYYTIEENGLNYSWANERVFMNPPYGNKISAWIEKAFAEMYGYFNNHAEIVVGLLPARTDTKWFHEYIYNIAEIRFLKGRVKFSDMRGVEGSAPFPSMVVIWK